MTQDKDKLVNITAAKKGVEGDLNYILSESVAMVQSILAKMGLKGADVIIVVGKDNKLATFSTNIQNNLEVNLLLDDAKRAIKNNLGN